MMPEHQQNDHVIPLSPSLNKERELIHRQMISSVSHDLKTPLAGIIGSLEIHNKMQDNLEYDKRQALLETALQEAYRLDAFITNILDIAKLENGQMKMRSELCDIGHLLQMLLMKMAPLLKHNNVHLYAHSGILTVHTDPVLLARAVGILLDNAIKYGDPKGTISVEYGRNDFAQDFIRVRDHGRGIDASLQDNIFCKYTRFVKQDSQNAGTGLGLAICREIMALLGGSVSAGNHENGGALFTLTFPAG